MVNIPTPCKEEVEKYLKKWDEDKTISLHDSNLNYCLRICFPKIRKRNIY